MAVSYSQEVKNEICRAKTACQNCEKALLYGMLLFTRGISEKKIAFNTENKESVHLFTRLMVDQFGVIVTVMEPDFRTRPIYCVAVEDETDTRRVLDAFHLYQPAEPLSIDFSFLQKECCKTAFLRGAYLACGTMIDPQKEYHLEFNIAQKPLCEPLLALLQEFHLDFRKTVRGKNHILYIKESEQLADTLARFGATKASFELLNLKIEKGLRNRANRAANCDTANIEKTVSASMEQIKKLQKLRDQMGLETLPPALKEAAELRLDHPEASLRELCELSRLPVSRSGLNHRLQKLCEMADHLQ